VAAAIAVLPVRGRSVIRWCKAGRICWRSRITGWMRGSAPSCSWTSSARGDLLA